jgi:hypothetical protein
MEKIMDILDEYGSDAFIFGEDAKTGEMLHVSQVNRGKKSGCICPSCKMNLIARKGEVLRWHFAHDHKSDNYSPSYECDYNPYIYIKKYLREVFANGCEVLIPELNVTESAPHPSGSRMVSKTLTVANEKKVNFSGCTFDENLEGSPTDVTFRTGEYQISFIFLHPPEIRYFSFSHLQIDKLGVIGIRLPDILINLIIEFKHGANITEFLKNELATNASIMSWLYHYNKKYIARKAREGLKAELNPYSGKGYRRQKSYITESQIEDAVRGIKPLK